MISYIGGKSIIGKWIRDYIPTDIETFAGQVESKKESDKRKVHTLSQPSIKSRLKSI